MTIRFHRSGPERAFRVAGVLAGLALLRCVFDASAAADSLGAGDDPSYTGAAACESCHQKQYALWKESRHRVAMQAAGDDTVLGDFDDASFEYAGITTTFFRRDGRFHVRTDGPDGALRDYEIAYTFGVWPLQQYLVAFPDGRMQALSIAWDARSRSDGGQRWFHLYPDERITHRDELHWTRRAQNWNWMCAECHSTNLRRNYDAAADRYATTWSDIGVGCEACHGPGSRHVAWARKAPGWEASASSMGLTVMLDERRDVTWGLDPATGSVARSRPLTTHREVEMCAQCHARRAPFADGLQHGSALMETHDPVLLRAGLYFADGQQQDEVYEYGSFLQSRMYARGVTCSDCHEPHGGGLRAPGGAVCAQCHTSGRYTSRAHTMHAPGTEGASCVSCHMPRRTYMGVDVRNDHSIRVPRPDLSAALGTPDACSDCHRDKDARWAAEQIERTFGPRRLGYQTFGATLDAARWGLPGAAAGLVALAGDQTSPGVARATAVAELERYLDPSTLPVVERMIGDSDPLVRGAALDALMAAPPQQRIAPARALLDDPVRVVRLKAARALAAAVPAAGDAALERRFAEYVASLRANSELPDAHLNLGLFYADRREPEKAEQEYRHALRLDADYAPAYLNLADLFRALSRDADGEAVLLEGRRRRPRDGALAHALGLLRVRQRRYDEAAALLGEAVEHDPDNARFARVHAVALHELGRPEQARAVLATALSRSPYDRELLATAADYARAAGDDAAAMSYGTRLDAIEAARAMPAVPARTDQAR